MGTPWNCWKIMRHTLNHLGATKGNQLLTGISTFVINLCPFMWKKTSSWAIEDATGNSMPVWYRHWEAAKTLQAASARLGFWDIIRTCRTELWRTTRYRETQRKSIQNPYKIILNHQNPLFSKEIKRESDWNGLPGQVPWRLTQKHGSNLFSRWCSPE